MYFGTDVTSPAAISKNALHSVNKTVAKTHKGLES